MEIKIKLIFVLVGLEAKPIFGVCLLYSSSISRIYESVRGSHIYVHVHLVYDFEYVNTYIIVYVHLVYECEPVAGWCHRIRSEVFPVPKWVRDFGGQSVVFENAQNWPPTWMR